jgi:hypothetical protein
MKLVNFILLIGYFTLTACNIGMPTNIAVGIGGGNSSFGLGTTINFPVNTKPAPAEPPVIVGTEKQPTEKNKQKNRLQ